MLLSSLTFTSNFEEIIFRKTSNKFNNFCQGKQVFENKNYQRTRKKMLSEGQTNGHEDIITFNIINYHS